MLSPPGPQKDKKVAVSGGSTVAIIFINVHIFIQSYSPKPAVLSFFKHFFSLGFRECSPLFLQQSDRIGRDQLYSRALSTFCFPSNLKRCFAGGAREN